MKNNKNTARWLDIGMVSWLGSGDYTHFGRFFYRYILIHKFRKELVRTSNLADISRTLCRYQSFSQEMYSLWKDCQSLKLAGSPVTRSCRHVMSTQSPSQPQMGRRASVPACCAEVVPAVLSRALVQATSSTVVDLWKCSLFTSLATKTRRWRFFVVTMVGVQLRLCKIASVCRSSPRMILRSTQTTCFVFPHQRKTWSFWSTAKSWMRWWLAWVAAVPICRFNPSDLGEASAAVGRQGLFKLNSRGLHSLHLSCHGANVRGPSAAIFGV